MNSDASLAALQVPSYSLTYLPTFLTYGCSPPHLRLQGAMLYGGLALLDARNAYAHTPLHVAVSHGATRAVRTRVLGLGFGLWSGIGLGEGLGLLRPLRVAAVARRLQSYVALHGACNAATLCRRAA